MRRSIWNLGIVLSSLISVSVYSQSYKKPKLVVGIVVDQMRAEYLYRFQEHYTSQGFKRLMNDGCTMKNVHYNYIPTETGPGHASIYTGTTPADHGIVSNHWYERAQKKTLYCVMDSTVIQINSNTKKENSEAIISRSPKNLLTSTITDELKLFSNQRARVVGLSLKDRGAILPAGHLADYAFWYDKKTGDFVTSSFYTNDLPDWVSIFNAKKKADAFLSQVWEPLLPIAQYIQSDQDNVPHERIYVGKETPTFPYDLKVLHKENGGYGMLLHTPFGNSLLTDMAIATLDGERLGQGVETDFLTISYSSTDKVGHDFGIRSKELEDTYVRLDRDLARLLEALDQKVGKDNYLLFLTADHAASDTPVYLKKMKIPSGFYIPDMIKEGLNAELSSTFGEATYIAYMDNTQLYLDEKVVQNMKVITRAEHYLKQLAGIKNVYAPVVQNRSLYNSKIAPVVKNSYYAKRSGDLYLQFLPGWMQQWKYGTTHYDSYNNDTHVPLLWYGWNIPKRKVAKSYKITQLAATIALLLDIPFPNAATKSPMIEVLEIK